MYQAGGVLWLMLSTDVNQNNSTEVGGEFWHLLKVWPCKLAVCCPVCIDVCFGLAVGQKCPNLLLPCARWSRAQSCGSPTFHSSLGHGSTVHVRDRSLENRQGSQPALTGAVLTSGQLGEDLRPSRIRFDCWLKAPMSTKNDSQLGYPLHISVQSGQGGWLFWWSCSRWVLGNKGRFSLLLLDWKYTARDAQCK